jgi:putative oxidoreductase
MYISLHHHETFAVLIARVFLGFLFFFQGYDAVFKVKLNGVIAAIERPLYSTGIPRVLIVLGAYFTSYVELIGGLFLIIGFIKYYTLYLLGFNLIVASIAFSITKPMWDMKHVFPRLVLLLFLLLVPANWDVLSVDYFWSLLKFIKHI